MSVLSDHPSAHIDICTVMSKCNLPKVRVLYDSFRRWHSTGRFFALLVDEPDGFFDPKKEPFEIIRVEELGLENLDAMRMRYDVVEFCSAVRPRLFLHLLAMHGCKRLAHVDSDIVFFSPLTKINALLDTHSVILSPHLTAPIPEDEAFPNERTVLSSGAYNSGFIAVRNDESAHTLLLWWEEKLERHAHMDVGEHLFGDQRWMDLMPGMFAGVHVLRDPTCNAAFWNLHSHPLKWENDHYAIGAAPLTFFHFSGFKPGSPPIFSVHQTRFRLSENSALQRLLEEYQRLLFAAGYPVSHHWPYSYDKFENGVAISPIIRRIYDDMDGEKLFPHPFSTNGTSFFHWLMIPATDVRDGGYLTNFHLRIHSLNPQASVPFPAPKEQDMENFAQWLWHIPSRQLSLDRTFLSSLKPFVDRAASQSTKNRRSFRRFLGKRHTSPSYQVLCRCVRLMMGNTLYNYLKPKRPPVKLSLPFRVRPKKKQLSPLQHKNTLGLIIIGSLHAENGIGEGLRGYMEALHAVGIPFETVNVHSAPGRESVPLPPFATARKTVGGPLLFVGGPDELEIMLSNVSPNDATYRIAYISWEPTQFPKRYLPLLACVDEVWTCSRFSADAIAMTSPVPVVTMSLAIRIGETVKTLQNKKEESVPFTFLFVFDYFSTFDR
jgi:hypothetical protein